MSAPDLTALPPVLLAVALSTAPDEDTAQRVRAELDRRRVMQDTPSGGGVAIVR
jgi:hypothetical protein